MTPCRARARARARQGFINIMEIKDHQKGDDVYRMPGSLLNNSTIMLKDCRDCTIEMCSVSAAVQVDRCEGEPLGTAPHATRHTRPWIGGVGAVLAPAVASSAVASSAVASPPRTARFARTARAQVAAS